METTVNVKVLALHPTQGIGGFLIMNAPFVEDVRAKIEEQGVIVLEAVEATQQEIDDADVAE